MYLEGYINIPCKSVERFRHLYSDLIHVLRSCSSAKWPQYCVNDSVNKQNISNDSRNILNNGADAYALAVRAIL